MWYLAMFMSLIAAMTGGVGMVRQQVAHDPHEDDEWPPYSNTVDKMWQMHFISMMWLMIVAVLLLIAGLLVFAWAEQKLPIALAMSIFAGLVWFTSICSLGALSVAYQRSKDAALAATKEEQASA